MGSILCRRSLGSIPRTKRLHGTSIDSFYKPIIGDIIGDMYVEWNEKWRYWLGVMIILIVKYYNGYERSSVTGHQFHILF